MLKIGNITIEDLKPDDCLTLVSKLNRKKFLNRTIYVTSVVPHSPEKSAVSSSPEKEATTKDTNLEHENHQLSPQFPLNLSKKSDPKSPATPSISLSPSVQQHVCQFENSKRKMSPENVGVDLSKKEKKMLREEEKKKKKLEYKEKNMLSVEVSHTL